ncbi:siderophore-interacting protein [Skermania sp. ID1734]|uniref:siderophore-interacting protein n=1 Tax=Skermania sp. ID1734 TaxID=2597516 RepID=UPI00117E768F|nr:siderophore-interacting protein [Skermania sp. ID1734]TSE01424.1 siderophore-interacting protein [Skermania sp. ID1734]
MTIENHEASTGHRGLQGALLKAFGANDYQLTVTGKRAITDNYIRLSFNAGGLLDDRPIHPTMWIRMWFPNGSKLHQRGYTLVDPDRAADTFDVEFAIHDGNAARWALAAQPGDTITASVLGTNFELPETAPKGYLIVGDTASIPAINSLLGAIGDVPARVWVEWVHSSDRSIPLAQTAHTDVVWVQRGADGASLVAAVADAAFDAHDHFGFVACDFKTTRAVTSLLRHRFRLNRKAIKSQAYWK